MRAVIIAGGEPREDLNWQRWVREGDLTIGADGGAARALAHGLEPEWVIGDMDSLPDEEKSRLEALGSRFMVHPPAKDETDLELSLAFATERGAREIIVLGALGGRLDHTLANLLLMTLPALSSVRVRIVEGDEEAFVVRAGESVSVHGRIGDTVSLLPLVGDAHGVTTTGLAWQLVGEALKFGFTRGVSNVMVAAEASIQVEKGVVLVVHGPPEMA